jgi:hypothetical protein
MKNETSPKGASSRQTPLDLHRYICVGEIDRYTEVVVAEVVNTAARYG